MIERPQILGHAFRQQYSIRSSRHDSSEIIESDAARQWIDPNIAAEPDGTGGGEEIAGLTARQRPIRRNHRILEVEDQRIGARLRRTRELAFAIGWNKQQGAHSPLRRLDFSGRHFIKPARRQIATVSPRWLIP